MRSPTTRAIVGLLLLTGVATWGAEQAGFLTGSVIQDELMQFQVQSPFATQENGVITIPAGTDVLLDWNRIDGKIFADDGLNMNGITDCVMFASRPIGPLTVEQPGGLANSPDAYSLMQMEYGVLPISAITAPVSFNLKCYNTSYQTQNSYQPVVSLTVQVNVGNVDTSVLQPYAHRSVTYPPVISPTTFTLTSGATVSGSDNILDVKPGSTVTMQWEQLEKGVNSGGCWLAFSQPVPGATVDPSVNLNPGWQDTYGSQYWSVKSTGSMTIPNMQASTTAMLWCSKPFGEYGTAYPYQMYRHVYVQPEPQCGDGKDNDSNGKTDYPADTGCASPTDNVEFDATSIVQCNDGIDNDADGKKDYGPAQDVRAWGPAVVPVQYYSSNGSQLLTPVTLATGLVAGQTLTVTTVGGTFDSNGTPTACNLLLNSSYQFPSAFFADGAGNPVNFTYPWGVTSQYLLIYEGMNYVVPPGATQFRAIAPFAASNCSFAGTVASASNFDPDCSSALDNTENVSAPGAQNCSQADAGYCGPKGCAAGLTLYGGHTYLRYDTPAGSWQDARTHCQSIGGDLVGITSSGEQSAVYNGLVGTGRSDLWIGLSDTANEGSFKLVDGSTPSYSNWYPGNPDDGYSNEDCVEMNYSDYAHDGHWNDFPCDNGYGRNTGFICELPKDCGGSSSSATSSKASSSSSAPVGVAQCNDGIDNDGDGAKDALVEKSDPNSGPERTFLPEEVRTTLNALGSPLTPVPIPESAAVASTLETGIQFCERVNMKLYSVAGVDKSYYSFFNTKYDTVAGKQYGWNGKAFVLNGDPSAQNLIWIKCSPLSSVQCGDGLDNDADGSVDFPFDAGCASVNDDSELPHDLDCDNAADTSEAGPKGNSINVKQTPAGFGGIAFDGSDIVFMPLQSGDQNTNGKVLVFGPSFKPASCGDGIPTSNEQCDDGNTVSGDGCSKTCIWESYKAGAGYCGDGICKLPEVSTKTMQTSYAPGQNWILCPEDCDNNAPAAPDVPLDCNPGELCPDGSLCLNDGTCLGAESSTSSSARSSARSSSRSSASFGFASSSPLLVAPTGCIPGSICANNAFCTVSGTCPGVCFPGTLCPTGDLCPANGLCPNACDPGSTCANGAMCNQNGLCPLVVASSSRSSAQAFIDATTCFPGTLCADGQLCNDVGVCPPALSSSSASSLQSSSVSSEADHTAAPLVDFSTCTENLDCPSNVCIGGFCGCTNSMQCGGNACIGGFCTNIPAGSLAALSLCASNVECPVGMTCQGGACEPDSGLCGNGRIDAGEVCDDGNAIDNDSCSIGCLYGNNSSCTSPRQCQSLICTNGICGSCTTDTQCPEDMICTSGSCVTGHRSAVLSNNILIPSELAAILASGTGFNLYNDGTTYEQYQAMVLQHGAPLPSSGPESVAIMAAGASAGYTWMKMKRKTKKKE